jgi:uncharacterized protein
MQVPDQAVLLRVFIGETDRFGSHALFEAIVMKAREIGMAGATVLRGPMGYGQSSHLHSAKILRLSEDLPVVIEVVDSRDKIDQFATLIGPMIGSGLITLENVQVLRYGDNPGSTSTP